MKTDVQKFLMDVVLSIDAIESYVSDLSDANDFKQDFETIDSVERRLSIIGEAVWQADKTEPNLAITDKKLIIKFRHLLVHHYDLITNSTVWGIIKTNLPVLRKEVELLLTQYGDSKH